MMDTNRYIFISNLIKKMVMLVKLLNVIITNNASVCRIVSLLVEQIFFLIFLTSCVVHTLNLTLKKIFIL